MIYLGPPVTVQKYGTLKKIDMSEKSSVDEIRRRFDADVERFSNLETGQSATVDAPLSLELITQAAALIRPEADSALDIGCGAGNYTLKLLQRLPDLEVTLVDLSRPMLARAEERIRPFTTKKITTIQADIRQVELGEEVYDLILAAAVFHHLRSDSEWESVFLGCWKALKPGGVIFISDLVEHPHLGVQQMMTKRWGEYLTGLKGESYRENVFAYVEHEDTPRSLFYQLCLLKNVGFRLVDVLHKNSCFAAFYAVK
jgi:tRNA (cmo5U34)-methyltransferase